MEGVPPACRGPAAGGVVSKNPARVYMLEGCWDLGPDGSAVIVERRGSGLNQRDEKLLDPDISNRGKERAFAGSSRGLVAASYEGSEIKELQRFG